MPVTINGTSGVTTPALNTSAGTANFDSLSTASNALSAVNSMGFRNRIINGGMVIDQRNAGASVTPSTGTYSLDRWRGFSSQSSKFTIQQNAGGVTPPAGFSNYLGAVSSAATSLGATDLYLIQQFVEGFNMADLAWGTASAQPVTLSFWVRSSLTGTFGANIQNNIGDRSYPFTYVINSANTWEYKTVTIPGSTSGTWESTNQKGIALSFSLGAGSNVSGTAGAWTTTVGIYSATGATSVVGTNGATFYITGVQLEAGSVATPFERRDYGRELMMCQRYYEKSYDLTTVPGTNTFIGAVVGFGLQGATLTTQNIVLGPVRFGITKRATPTIVLYDLSGNSGRVNADEVGLGSSNNQIASVGSELNMQGFGVIRTPTQAAANGGRFQYTASAEL